MCCHGTLISIVYSMLKVRTKLARMMLLETDVWEVIRLVVRIRGMECGCYVEIEINTQTKLSISCGGSLTIVIVGV